MELDQGLQGRVRAFLEQTLGAMGLPLEIAVEDTPDSVRLELSGDGGEVLLQRRGETLDALQHIVNTAFRRELEGRSHVRARLPRLPSRARTPS